MTIKMHGEMSGKDNQNARGNSGKDNKNAQ